LLRYSETAIAEANFDGPLRGSKFVLADVSSGTAPPVRTVQKRSLALKGGLRCTAVGPTAMFKVGFEYVAHGLARWPRHR